MGQGRVMMEEIYEENHYDQQYRVMARAQDEIGWRRFFEGMICKEIGRIQGMPVGLQASRLSAEKWGVGLVTKLLEVTHGQWLYHNIQVHLHSAVNSHLKANEQTLVSVTVHTVKLIKTIR